MDREDFLSTLSYASTLTSLILLRSHLLKSLERQILRIWEQREAFTPYYLGTEGVSPYGGNIGILKYEHVNGRE